MHSLERLVSLQSLLQILKQMIMNECKLRSSVFAHANKPKLLLSFLSGVWSISVGFRIFISLLVPLVIVEVVSHLTYCLCTRSLVLHGHFGEAGRCIEFDVAGVEDILVVVIDLHVLITGDSLVVITSYWSHLDFSKLVQLAAYFVCLIVFLLLIVFIFLFFWLVLGWGGRGRFCPCFYVIGWEKTFFIWTFYDVAKPPSVLIGLLYQYLIAFFQIQICDLLRIATFLFFALIFLIFVCILVIKFILSFLSQLLFVIFFSRTFECLLFLFISFILFIQWFFLLFGLCRSKGGFGKIVECFCNKHQLQGFI